MTYTKLRKMKEDKGLRLKDIAFHMGVSVSTVGDWVSGRIAPTTDKSIKLAKFLGTTVEELFGEDGGAL